MFTILTKEDCPWCDKAKEFLTEKGEDFVSSSYRDDPLYLKLMRKAGLKTVPQIWHNDEYIGGYEALVAYWNLKEEEDK